MSPKRVTWIKEFRLRHSKLCRNGVCQGERKSCLDIAFLCHDRVLAKPRGLLVATEHFYVATKFG